MIRRLSDKNEFMSMHHILDKWVIIYRDFYGNVKYKEFNTKPPALRFIRDTFDTKTVNI